MWCLKLKAWRKVLEMIEESGKFMQNCKWKMRRIGGTLVEIVVFGDAESGGIGTQIWGDWARIEESGGLRQTSQMTDKGIIVKIPVFSLTFVLVTSVMHTWSFSDNHKHFPGYLCIREVKLPLCNTSDLEGIDTYPTPFLYISFCCSVAIPYVCCAYLNSAIHVTYPILLPNKIFYRKEKVRRTGVAVCVVGSDLAYCTTWLEFNSCCRQEF